MKLAAISLAAVLLPGVVWAQGENVEVDPIRCWWRTSAGAVRTGETFSVVLTCAVIQNAAVEVVPDESRLGPAVIQMAPFEIVGGAHPDDLRTPDRRFFQYEYNIRMISPDAIGKDVTLPVQTLHYRINSKVSGNAELQGRDHTYLLPSLSVRVLSMVPADAPDIRDSNGESFAEAERYRLRAGVLDIVGTTLVALGVVMTIITLVRLARHAARKRPVEQLMMSERAVLGTAKRELASVQHDAESQEWTPEHISRALAATRIAAGLALGRQPTLRKINDQTPAGDGRLVARAGLWPRGKATAVSSSATADDIRRKLSTLSPAAESRRPLLESVQAALTTFTAALYARDGSPDRASLDSALTQALDAVRRLRAERIWPKPHVRRWFGRTMEMDRPA